MYDNQHPPADTPDGFVPGEGSPAPAGKPGGIRRSVKTLAAGAILLGATAGAVLIGPMSVFAASPTASASAAPSAAPGTATTPNGHVCDGDHARNGGASGSSSSSSSGSPASGA